MRPDVEAKSVRIVDPAMRRADHKPRKQPKWGARSNQTTVGRWFWETDRMLLLMVAILIAIGLIAVAAASPAAAERLSGGKVQFAPLRFFFQQLMWIAVALPVMIAVSMLPKTMARRLAIAGAIVCTIMLMLVPVIGMEKNGAVRWIDFGITAIQPSEFLKPLYVVSIAWLLSLKRKDPSLPMVMISGLITAVLAFALMRQPNLGETVIFALTFVALLTLSGAHLRYLYMLGGAGAGALVLAYFFYPVATQRINGFLFDEGDSGQTDAALETLTSGGLFGLGPGAGTRKFTLPEPHTDYIFSVIGEEFGMIACLAIAILYLTIIARVLIRMLNEEDLFTILAAGGLVIQIGLQAVINMAVNVHLLPSKGMTLPFISYGGSSLIALSIGFGLLLAFTRRNPYLHRSPYVVRWSGRE
jgi:cell division protein FtsW